MIPHLTVFLMLFSASVVFAQDKPADDPFVLFPIVADPSGMAYFPKGQESFYTGYLAAMKEPSLLSGKSKKGTISLRFTWLRSFHDPIAIRVWQEDGVWQVRGVRLKKQQDYRPGPVDIDKTRVLTKEESDTIERLSMPEALWNPLNKEESLIGGLDGAGWVFEKVAEQSYAMIDLWTPQAFKKDEYKQAGVDVAKIRNFDPFVRLGLCLLELADLLPQEEDIY